MIINFYIAYKISTYRFILIFIPGSSVISLVSWHIVMCTATAQTMQHRQTIIVDAARGVRMQLLALRCVVVGNWPEITSQHTSRDPTRPTTTAGGAAATVGKTRAESAVWWTKTFLFSWAFSLPSSQQHTAWPQRL